MKIVTAKEMQKIDEMAIRKLGIPRLTLMENAGKSLFHVLQKHYFDLLNRNILMVAGKGNNGGDGFVVARLLREKGAEVHICLAASQDDLKNESLENFKRCETLRIPIFSYTPQALKKQLKETHLVIDALFGTGLHSVLNPSIRKLIQIINSKNIDVVSIDIPSGVHGDTGEIMGQAIKAKITVALGLPKLGLILSSGIDCTGQLEIENIGFPKSLLEKAKSDVYLLTSEDIQKKIPKRLKSTHKGQAGRVLIVAGSQGKMGAAVMAVQSAFRSGAGLVTLLTQKEILKILSPQVKEAFLNSFVTHEEKYKKYLDQTDVSAIGPGIGFSVEAKNLLKWTFMYSKVPVVIDADGLTILSQNLSWLKKTKAPVILTPHPGEMARLLNISTQKVQKDRLSIAREFSQKHHVFLILKGAATLVASPQGKVFINNTGNPAMATAGMGDVLTGMIVSFIAQGLAVQDALKSAVYLHGFAADQWVFNKKASRGLLASDIIKMLPEMIESYVS